MYRLVFSKNADKTLRKMAQLDAERIRKKLDQLVKDPYATNNNAKKLQNRAGYRLRVGDWRIIYDIDNQRIIVFVFKIASRSEVYR